MNDRWTYTNEGHKNATLLASTERIVRLASQNHVAVMFLSVFMGSLSICDQLYGVVCAHYGMPMLSYRSVVLKSVRYAFGLHGYNSSVHVNRTRYPVLYNTRLIEDLHPLFQSHVILAQFVCDFIEKAYTFYSLDSRREAILKEWQGRAVPTAVFGGDEGSELTEVYSSCHPIQTFYSSLPSDQYFVTNSVFHKSSEAVGWKYMTDYPDKPKGWVSDGSKPLGKLLFPTVLLHGHVTVTYLQSHKNSGKFQVYFQPTKDLKGHFINTGVEKIIAHPNMIPCCKNPWSTHAAYVDTYDNTTMTSVIVSRTFHFDMIGLVNVVFKRVPLSTEETARRSGDKVKILSLRTC
jgi:hypothetical protein